MKCLAAILAALIFLAPLQSRAAEQPDSLARLGKKTVVVAKGATYGALGGLVIGLASQAFHRSTRNIFLFGSLGLYAGIGMGIYAISTSKGATPYEGPDTYDDYMGKMDKLVPTREQEILLAKELEKPRLSVYSVSF